LRPRDKVQDESNARTLEKKASQHSFEADIASDEEESHIERPSVFKKYK